MKRPLFIVTLGAISGIIVGMYLPKIIPITYLYIVIILLIKVYELKSKKIKNILCKFIITNMDIILLYSITLCILSTLIYNENQNYNNKYKKYDNQEINIKGIIISDIKEKEYKYVFKVKVESINGVKKYKDDYVLINLKKTSLIKAKYGEKIILKGTYEEPSKARNYKGFDYKNYLKTEKIYGIVNSENIKKIIEKDNVSFIDLINNWSIKKLQENLQKLLPNKTAPLAMGVLLGYVDYIDDEITTDFKDSNLTHMLAISGENTAYVILILNVLLNKKIFGNKGQKLITIIVMVIFMKITGMTLSVIRAGITCIIYMLASLVYRKADVINTISIACLLTLLENPFSIFNAGMQLSYAGTISIILFYDILDKKIKTKNKILKYILESMALSFSANIFIIPIMAYQFNTVSLTFLFSNLLASPVIGIATIAGVITSIVSFFSIKIAKLPAIILNISLQLVIKIAKFFADISISKIVVTTPSIYVIIFIYLLEIVSLYLYKLPKEKLYYIKNKYKKIFFKGISLVLISVIIIQFCTIVPQKNRLIIHFIDVGQGDSCLLETPAGMKMLIDSGGSTTANIFDVGEKTLLPYLLDRKIKILDYVMISHFDEDHCQGLESVIKNIKINNLVISKQSIISEEYLKIIKMSEEKKIKIIVVKRGYEIKIDKYIGFKIYNPSDKFIDDGKGGLNANAIVAQMYYKMDTGCLKILFTGDIEENTEKELVSIYGKQLKSDILKVAHHGSKTSSTKEFLNEVKPSISLVGVGKKNKFGHPNSDVINRINQLNSKIYRTDLCGEITLSVNKDGKVIVKTKTNDV